MYVFIVAQQKIKHIKMDCSIEKTKMKLLEQASE